MIKTTLVTVCALLGLTMGQSPDGIKASLDVAILEQAKDVYMDTLL